MLLTLLQNFVDVGAPVLSTGNGVVCLHTTLHTATLHAPVLIDELQASVLMGELVASITDVTLTKRFVC